MPKDSQSTRNDIYCINDKRHNLISLEVIIGLTARILMHVTSHQQPPNRPTIFNSSMIKLRISRGASNYRTVYPISEHRVNSGNASLNPNFPTYPTYKEELARLDLGQIILPNSEFATFYSALCSDLLQRGAREVRSWSDHLTKLGVRYIQVRDLVMYGRIGILKAVALKRKKRGIEHVECNFIGRKMRRMQSVLNMDFSIWLIGNLQDFVEVLKRPFIASQSDDCLLVQRSPNWNAFLTAPISLQITDISGKNNEFTATLWGQKAMRPKALSQSAKNRRSSSLQTRLRRLKELIGEGRRRMQRIGIDFFKVN
ncbi:hypothetical protein Syun_001538 [Stephania yunnanensis]|uniref:Uncharacterized protein n=1 Tax=Stephania yunnanensis TaxID=152371 RepID=A0AAP0LF07_9MAGN